jgi:A/G-specific adenine glycosylase
VDESAVADTWPENSSLGPALGIDVFRSLVWQKGMEHYRSFPWRQTRDPYAIWISEVMLQQTQVTRVDGRWQRWLSRFPTIEELAHANQTDVLEEWQGMGYNRRALSLLKAARTIVENGEGFPRDPHALVSLPGIGPATAAGIRAFAFNLPGVYLETNVRTVFLHELYPEAKNVPDKLLAPLVEASCSRDDPRGWYYALLDYGAWLKRTVPNPSRRSRAHVKQSHFEGSHRQKRAEVVRLLLAAREKGATADDIASSLSRIEESAGREAVELSYVEALLGELAKEGFCSETNGRWHT